MPVWICPRLFASSLRAQDAASARLQAYRRECEQLAPLAVMHYLQAALARPAIKALLPSIRCRVLLVYGGEALHQADCIELATLVNKERFAILEVAQVGRRRRC